MPGVMCGTGRNEGNVNLCFPNLLFSSPITVTYSADSQSPGGDHLIFLFYSLSRTLSFFSHSLNVIPHTCDKRLPHAQPIVSFCSPSSLRHQPINSRFNTRLNSSLINHVNIKKTYVVAVVQELFCRFLKVHKRKIHVG